MASFYEFFAGGGMARAGLGPDWQCLLANDFDPKKAASYAANWGTDHLRVGDVAALTFPRPKNGNATRRGCSTPARYCNTW